MTRAAFLALAAASMAIALPSGGLGSPSVNTLYLSPTGNDAGRCTQAAPCATFDRAYHVAGAGDTVAVQGGLYPQTDAGARTTRILPDANKTGPSSVTFACSGNGDVTFAAPAFTIQAAYVTIRGGCFHFHRLYLSQRGSTDLDAANITIDGVHMSTIEIAGADKVLVRNSEIGPVVDCYEPGRTGTGLVGGPITPEMWCDPNNPIEGYWATVSDGTETNQGQPFIHRNSGREATNITFEGNLLHGIQTKDPFNLHSGGFLLQARPGSCDNLLFRGNRWDGNFGFNMLFDGAADCVTLENNWFGRFYEAPPNSSKEIAYRPGVEIKTGMQTSLSKWVVRRNIFAHGLGFDPDIAYSNIQVVENIMTPSGCAARLSGISYDHNIVVGGTCGADSLPVPFGYEVQEGSLKPKAAQAAAVRIIFAQAFRGLEPAKIARSLRTHRLPAPGGRRWTAVRVVAIIKDPVYVGAFYGPAKAHPALVTAQVFKRAQRVVAPKKPPKKH